MYVIFEKYKHSHLVFWLTDLETRVSELVCAFKPLHVPQKDHYYWFPLNTAE